MLKQKMSGKIHTRNLKIAIFEGQDETIIVEGELTDDRLQPYYISSGEQRPPGTLHHMVIRMQVAGPSFLIKKIEVEMMEYPRKECPETANSLDKIKGLRIAPGFSSEVKKLVGGNKGCTHLTTLLLAMGPAAVQGYWSYYVRKPSRKEIYSESMQKYLIDTCQVWRKDGPAAMKLREKV